MRISGMMVVDFENQVAYRPPEQEDDGHEGVDFGVEFAGACSQGEDLGDPESEDGDYGDDGGCTGYGRGREADDGICG